MLRFPCSALTPAAIALLALFASTSGGAVEPAALLALSSAAGRDRPARPALNGSLPYCSTVKPDALIGASQRLRCVACVAASVCESA